MLSLPASDVPGSASSCQPSRFPTFGAGPIH